MAVAQRSPATLPDVPRHRVVAIAGSIAGHLILIVGLVLLGTWAAEEEEPEPIRLVFVEPAPPPKLGVPDGGAAPGPPAEAAPAPEPAAPEPPPAPVMEYHGEPALMPPRPEPVAEKPKPEPKPKPKPKPEPERRPAAAAKPAPEPRAPAPPAAGDTAGTVAAPRGDAAGHAAGVAGGLVGGQVGGLGSELTPLKQAAVPPRVVHRVLPDYPESARLRGIEGQVMIEAIIARDGSVEPGMKVVQSIPALDDAALAAFKRWRFTPARDAQGRPIRVILQAPVRFVLR